MIPTLAAIDLQLDFTQVIVSLGTLAGTFISLVVWLVKWSEKRNAKTQDAFLNFLQEQLAVHQQYGKGIADLKQEVETQTNAIVRASDVQKQSSAQLVEKLDKLSNATNNLCKHNPGGQT